MDESKVKGVLYTINEEGVLIMDQSLEDTVAFIDYQTIEKLRIRRKGNVGKGAAIGFVVGTVGGVLIGNGMDSSGYGTLGGFVFGTPTGTLIGMGIGSFKKSFQINGDPETYFTLLPELKSYELQPPDAVHKEEIAKNVHTPLPIELLNQ
jgi:hypothetical protein